MGRLRTFLAHVALRLWPLSFGLGRVVRLVGLPSPPAVLVTRRLRGFPLRLQFNPRSCQGRFLYYRGLYEERSIRQVCRLLRPGMTFVDAGANIGLYSVVAAHCVGPAGRVFAFEPQQNLAAVFRENLTVNGLANVTLETVGLGSASGMSDLYQVTDNDVQATLRLRADERRVGPVVRVPVRTLEDALQEHGVVSVDGLKIDVEGAELDVLRGFAAGLAAAPPRFILVECFDELLARFDDRSHDLITFLEARGYAVYRPRRGRWVRVAADGAPVGGDLLALHGGLEPGAGGRGQPR